ncbi:MAG: hypothetical protein RL418_603 [Actinomycetota bacterium]|jgi:antitoxin YefM
MVTNLTAFRQNLYQHVRDVLADETSGITITTKGGAVELVNSAELNSLREFHHLFTSPANAKRLLESLDRTANGEYKQVSLDQLKKLVGE